MQELRWRVHILNFNVSASRMWFCKMRSNVLRWSTFHRKIVKIIEKLVGTGWKWKWKLIISFLSHKMTERIFSEMSISYIHDVRIEIRWKSLSKHSNCFYSIEKNNHQNENKSEKHHNQTRICASSLLWFYHTYQILN